MMWITPLGGDTPPSDDGRIVDLDAQVASTGELRATLDGLYVSLLAGDVGGHHLTREYVIGEDSAPFGRLQQV